MSSSNYDPVYHAEKLLDSGGECFGGFGGCDICFIKSVMGLETGSCSRKSALHYAKEYLLDYANQGCCQDLWEEGR